MKTLRSIVIAIAVITNAEVRAELPVLLDLKISRLASICGEITEVLTHFKGVSTVIGVDVDVDKVQIDFMTWAESVGATEMQLSSYVMHFAVGRLRGMKSPELPLDRLPEEAIEMYFECRGLTPGMRELIELSNER